MSDMTQLHYEGGGARGGSVFSACVECTRCKVMSACVVFQAEDPHYSLNLCRIRCWPDLLGAIATNEEMTELCICRLDPASPTDTVIVDPKCPATEHGPVLWRGSRRLYKLSPKSLVEAAIEYENSQWLNTAPVPWGHPEGVTNSRNTFLAGAAAMAEILGAGTGPVAAELKALREEVANLRLVQAEAAGLSHWTRE